MNLLYHDEMSGGAMRWLNSSTAEPVDVDTQHTTHNTQHTTHTQFTIHRGVHHHSTNNNNNTHSEKFV